MNKGQFLTAIFLFAAVMQSSIASAACITANNTSANLARASAELRAAALAPGASLRDHRRAMRVLLTRSTGRACR
jgi:hypothetical protein